MYDFEPGRPVLLRGGTVLPMDDARSVLTGTDILVLDDPSAEVGRGLVGPAGAGVAGASRGRPRPRPARPRPTDGPGWPAPARRPPPRGSSTPPTASSCPA